MNLPPDLGPMPPPPPPEDWQAPRVSSGKALASLICGCAALLLSWLCPLIAVAAVVAVVLGIIGITETGRNGTRSGRGLAIAGTATGALALAGTIAVVVISIAHMKSDEQEREEARSERLSADVRLIVQRLREYHDQNHRSLGPGGPVLALAPPQSETIVERGPGQHFEADRIPDTLDGRVTGALQIRHLVRPGELQYSPRLDRWELEVIGNDKATIRARTRRGQVLREVAVTDAGKGLYVEAYGAALR